MTSHVTVRHTWEAGHRLPHLNGKCQSLHGHSWTVEVTVSGHVGDDGVLVEFADLKRHLRAWVDDHLDHGLMLGTEDPLVRMLLPHGKVYVFGQEWPTHPEDGPLLLWPTVENVAHLLARVMQQHLRDTGQHNRVSVERVDAQETAVNRATWTRL